MKPQENAHALVRKNATDNAVQALVAVMRKYVTTKHKHNFNTPVV